MKRFKIIGAARINFSVEVKAKNADVADEKVTDFDLQDILDNGVVTVDELQLEEAVVVVAQ